MGMAACLAATASAQTRFDNVLKTSAIGTVSTYHDTTSKATLDVTVEVGMPEDLLPR